MQVNYNIIVVDYVKNTDFFKERLPSWKLQ